MPRSPVTRFILQVLFWLPLCFAAWYYMAILMTMPVAWLSGLLISLLQPEAIEGVIQRGHELDVLTLLEPAKGAGIEAPEGQVPQLTFSIDVLKYSYGIPLFTALVLASPGGEEKWTRWIFGIVILYLVQTWGVYFESLLTLYIKLGTVADQQLVLESVQRELIALGYQLGALILPAVTPLVLWIVFNREFISKLAPGLGSYFSKPNK